MSNFQEKLNSLREPLKKEDIEVRISTQQERFFSFLLYKTARVDEKRLSESGLIWQNEFSYSPNGDLICKIQYFDERINQWVTRMDTGTDGANAMGQANKGLFSDSFKRAGFKFGIGAELYTMSNIDTQIWCNMQKYTDKRGNEKFALPMAIRYEKLFVSDYEVVNGQIATIEISCSKGVIYRFKNGKKWINKELLDGNQKTQPVQRPVKQQPAKRVNSPQLQQPVKRPQPLTTAPTADEIKQLEEYILIRLSNWTLEKILSAEKATMEELRKDEILFNRILKNIKA